MKTKQKEQLKQECIDCIAKAGEEELKIVYRKIDSETHQWS